MGKRIVLSFFILLLFLNLSLAQQNVVDSLKIMLSEENIPLKRASILLELHNHSYLNNPRQSLKYPEEVIRLYDENDFHEEISKAYQKMAMSYILMNEIDTAMVYLANAIDIAKKYDDLTNVASSNRTLGTAYWYKSDIEKAIELYTESLGIFEKLKDRQQIATTISNLGTAYYALGDFNRSIEYYKLGLDMIDESIYPEEVASYLNDIGTIYKEWGNLTRALEYFFNALKINRRINNRRFEAANLDNIGSIYFQEKDYNKALDYYRQGLEIENKIDNIYGMAQTFVSIGSVYLQISELDSGFYYFRNALKCYNHIDDNIGLANTYNKIGEAHLKSKKYDLSIFNFNMSKEMSEKTGDERGIAYSLGGIAVSYYYLGNYKKAVDTFIESIELAKNGNFVNLLLMNYQYISKAYGAFGEKEKQLKHLENYIAIKDTIFQNEKQKQASELLARFESEKKENEILLLHQQNLINENRLFRQRLIILTVVGLLLLTALGVFLLFMRYRQKKRVNLLLSIKNKEIEEKQIKIEAQNIKLEKQAKQLKELDEIKSRFFTNISHEFRTPLTLILGPTEQLIQNTDAPEVKSSLFMVKHNAQKLLGLINQLLNISKIEKGIVKMNFCTGNLLRYIVFITEMFSSQIESKGLKLEVKCDNEDCIGDFDKEKIEHIFLNLLSNAIKNTDKGGIIVSLNKTDNLNYISIKVSDTGKGIEKSKLPYVFDRFFMADQSESVGTGIGLAFTYELIKVYKGDVSIESEPGNGTVVSVFLPFSRKIFSDDEYVYTEKDDKVFSSQQIEPELYIQEQSGIKYIEKSSKDTVLIVEDNTELRKFIFDSLSSSYNILEAENGKVGIEMALKECPDLIITDVMMPEIDGIELARTLKSNPESSHIPIIMLTAKASEESKITGLNTQIDDYVTKPFSIRELSLRINNILNIRKKLQEKYLKSIVVSPSDVTTNSIDAQFLEKALYVVEENMSDPDFSVDVLCDKLGTSRTSLHNKLKSLLNQSATEFINTMRLKRAGQLIKQKSGNISEIAYDVGFNNLSYFSKIFKKHFNLSPSDMMNIKE